VSEEHGFAEIIPSRAQEADTNNLITTGLLAVFMEVTVALNQLK
jgi:hypothetical protein